MLDSAVCSLMSGALFGLEVMDGWLTGRPTDCLDFHLLLILWSLCLNELLLVLFKCPPRRRGQQLGQEVQGNNTTIRHCLLMDKVICFQVRYMMLSCEVHINKTMLWYIYSILSFTFTPVELCHLLYLWKLPSTFYPPFIHVNSLFFHIIIYIVLSYQWFTFYFIKNKTLAFLNTH